MQDGIHAVQKVSLDRQLVAKLERLQCNYCNSVRILLCLIGIRLRNAAISSIYYLRPRSRWVHRLPSQGLTFAVLYQSPISTLHVSSLILAP